MDGAILALCLAVLGGSAIGLVAYEMLVRSFAGTARDPGGRERAARASKSEGEGEAPPSSWRVRATGAIEAVSRSLDRAVPVARSDSDACRERLRRAGVSVSPETWRSVRVLASAGCAVLGATLSASVGRLALPQLLAFSVAAGALGWMLPAADLARRERRRTGSIEARLPDAMELLGIAVAAGSPVEQCFREVAASLDGPLSEELALVDQEVNLLGHTREQALENLAVRCRSHEVTAFVAQLTQAIKQGSSIASGLAGQAALARETAQADALERIRKMPTKLDIVLSMCFLPPTVVLVIVPTVVSLLEFLNESMS